MVGVNKSRQLLTEASKVPPLAGEWDWVEVLVVEGPEN